MTAVELARDPRGNVARGEVARESQRAATEATLSGLGHGVSMVFIKLISSFLE
jgi:hypothetical protein